MENDIRDWGERSLQRKFGALQLSCTALSYKGGKNVDENSASFCFETAKPILRYSNSSQRTNQTLFDHISLFQGRYVAVDTQLAFLGKPSLSVHIQSLGALSPADRTGLDAPAAAVSVTTRVQLTSSESENLTLRKVAPQYPSTAKMQGVQGRVIFLTVIGKDGHVLELHPLAGPQPLQKPAADAVRQWTYKPYLVDGEPVEVKTEVYVIFNLAG
jgi:hypothetical protein